MTKRLKKPIISVLAIFLLGTVADQVTKQWAQNTLLKDGFAAHDDSYPACGNPEAEMARARFVHRNAAPIVVIENMFSFRYVENCASAFNLMGSVPERLRFPFFLVVSLLACLFIPYMFLKTPPDQIYMLYSLPFVLSGALGNMLDRMITRYVIDFIDWFVVIGGKEYHWPIFNIADVSIVIGIGLMAIQLIVTGRQERETNKTETTDQVDAE